MLVLTSLVAYCYGFQKTEISHLMNGLSSSLMIPSVVQPAYKIAKWLRSFALTVSLPKGSTRFTKQGYVQLTYPKFTSPFFDL